MKKSRFLLFVLTIATVLLSACGAAAATPTVRAVAPKVDAVPVAFIGTIDSMAGDQWVINGNTVTVASDVVRDGPFTVGDQVKVEGAVSPDGSFAVSRVEPPTATDLSSLPPFGNENSNSNTNDANVNDGNINDANVNDVNSNDNSNIANSNDGNINDDNGNDANSNDDNSNSVNSNDDNGSDDNGNDANSNDDNGSGSNSNEDNGGDDHSGGGPDDNSGKGGGDNSGGGDDNSGGNGNDD